MRKKVLFLFVAVICLILAAVPCAAQPVTNTVKMYLQIDGIKGESTDTPHKDWIEILSYADRVHQGYNPAYSPLNMRSYMEPDFGSITVTKFVDLSSPKLYEAACTGKHFKKAQMEVYYKGFMFWMVNLEDVVITSMQAQIPEALLVSAAASDFPTETVNLNYGKIEWVYTQQKRADGSGGGNTTAKYDLTKTKAAQ